MTLCTSKCILDPHKPGACIAVGSSGNCSNDLFQNPNAARRPAAAASSSWSTTGSKVNSNKPSAASSGKFSDTFEHLSKLERKLQRELRELSGKQSGGKGGGSGSKAAAAPLSDRSTAFRSYAGRHTYRQELKHICDALPAPVLVSALRQHRHTSTSSGRSIQPTQFTLTPPKSFLPTYSGGGAAAKGGHDAAEEHPAVPPPVAWDSSALGGTRSSGSSLGSGSVQLTTTRASSQATDIPAAVAPKVII